MFSFAEYKDKGLTLNGYSAAKEKGGKEEAQPTTKEVKEAEAGVKEETEGVRARDISINW